ncbi:hypothetical protein [Nafulsella turpanensis]|uniref:hypothetical protein n=1 Tax=Nafulsella turpanensis TaxID=1265690 RepID=UPI00034DEE46|nr:hypothetical protein [Nafulsella turpanensis]
MENLMNWYNTKCEEANFNRLGLMAFILLVQTCIIVPVTLLLICVNGNDPIQFALMAVLSFAILVSLLGDMSSKIVLPLFIISSLIHLGLILINII